MVSVSRNRSERLSKRCWSVCPASSVVVLTLQPIGAELKGEEARAVGVELALGVHALAFEVVVDLNRGGDQRCRRQ